MGEQDPEFRPSWRNRRRVIFSTLVLDGVLVCAVVVGWLLLQLEINAGLSALMVAIVSRSTAIVASYVFGATWEDIRLWRS